MLTMGSSGKLAKREHELGPKFGGLVCPARAGFLLATHAKARVGAPAASDDCVEMSHGVRALPARGDFARCSRAQNTTRGGTGTWHSFAGVSQRMTFSQKRGMSS
jgi:hypothetical protein